MISLPSSATLGAIFGISELAISLFLRARTGSQDRGSLRMIWAVVALSLYAAINATYKLPQFAFPEIGVTYPLGVALFFIGLALRWYSIIYLGKFFTVNVAIAADHKVIDSGPYRYIRHPSYTGALLAFAGFGLSMGNGASLLIVLLPITAVFLYRIKVEEAVLMSGLGAAYSDYCRRSKRLIPFVY